MRAIGHVGYGQATSLPVPPEPRLTPRAVVVLESCYALPMAPEIAKALRDGARVFATDACYNQEHLKYVLDASGDLVPMLFDPWHAI